MDNDESFQPMENFSHFHVQKLSLLASGPRLSEIYAMLG
jgi:hypothetical protein